MLYRFSLLFALALASVTATAATQGGVIPVPLPLFPANNWWNTDVSSAPVDPNSANFINFIGANHIAHPDFGGNAGGGNVYGIPFIVVDGAQPKKTVSFVLYPSQSDGVGVPFYPIPDEAITMNGWIEGGQPGNVNQSGDRHMLIADKTNNTLYELYDVWYNGTVWEAGSGALFDMNTNDRRPEGWTSADAAGLAILPGLVRYDEYEGPAEIRHAFRVTVQSTNGYVYPASHVAGSTAGALPMGARLRMKASKDLSSYTPELQRLFRAFKKYGLIVADNGTNLYVTGTYDTRWNNGILNPAFHGLTASDFEVIQLGWAPSISLVLTMPDNLGNGDAASATLTAYEADGDVAIGYTGTVAFTSTDGAATLPVNYTFNGADAGTHAFPGGFTLRTPGSHVITFTDVAVATITGSKGVTVGPPTPTGLAATATSPSQVNVSWGSSSGAANYEVMRRSATSGDFVSLIVTPLTSYKDSTVTAPGAYVYKVRAIDASLRPSPFSAPDPAATTTFTNDPLVATVTGIKSAHITELRQAVNALRATAGLTASTFTDPVLSTSITVKAVHLQELRTALSAASTALGLTAASYTDPTLTGGSTIVKAAHVQELRNLVK
ncbi:MAG: hypothetical protein M3P06_21160 [Acidobacteriota bacterium]|nr:hypothetical protein [Acidobacteriota bacterium]